MRTPPRADRSIRLSDPHTYTPARTSSIVACPDLMSLAPAVAMELEAELQEADVLWPANHDDHQDHCHCHGGRHQQLEAAGKLPQGCGRDAPRGGVARRGAGSSAPVSISAGTRTGPSSWAWSYDSDESAAAEFVPPHVELAARRRCSEGRAASSVCVGQGRTLKGRDLQSLRTAVLRMTGFLET